jgi:hypothetical protein
MAIDPVGYARLVSRFGLSCTPLKTQAGISTAVHGRHTQEIGDCTWLQFQPSYAPDNSIVGDLQFAMRYEGINLEVLTLLFAATGPAELTHWIDTSPESTFARRAAFLYEWLTGNSLPNPKTASKSSYVSVLDETLQFGLAEGKRDTKYRVIDNLPGTQLFCPLVRKTPYLAKMVGKKLQQRTQETLAKYDRDLVRRAAEFLYLKETHSSFEVEREHPSPDKARRFADLLREAETGQTISADRFVELQNAVVDPRFREASYRTRQNWIGDDLGYRKRVEFVPPRPEDVGSLMEGLVALSQRLSRLPTGIDAVVAAAMVSFGFVFIHPFMDGNGRLHRYLIHESLSVSGFTPKGIVLPVSAVILASLDKYQETLSAFSRPVNDRTSYNPEAPQVPAAGNDDHYFRYFDATEQASFLYQALERTVEHDLDEEISFLLGFDRARQALNSLADWPDHLLETFIRVVHQNNDRLSVNKRKSHFAWMNDDELARFEQIVATSFSRDASGNEPTPR